jgi:hypothetical protein
VKAGQAIDAHGWSCWETVLKHSLVNHRNRVVLRRKILQKVWEYDSRDQAMCTPTVRDEKKICHA